MLIDKNSPLLMNANLIIAQNELAILSNHLYGIREEEVKRLLAEGYSFYGLLKQRLLTLISSKSIDIVLGSEYFDSTWYKESYLDLKNVVRTEKEAAKHYLLYGAYECRDPGPFFSTMGYLIHNHDVARARVPALLHYLKHGQYEGRAVRISDNRVMQ